MSEMSKAFVVLLMLFCHIVDDYYLQGILAQMKQRKWWKENAALQKYRFDYLIALVMHAMSWAFMIMLPVAIYYNFNIGGHFVTFFIANMLVHALVDNEKANKLSINLVVDQLIHILQIAVTALFLIFL